MTQYQCHLLISIPGTRDCGATPPQPWTGANITMRWGTADHCSGGYQFEVRKIILILLQLSWYIAEFYNTLTNLAMIVPGLYGMYTIRKLNLERRWDFFILKIIFHISLLAQIFCELPDAVCSGCGLNSISHDVTVSEREREADWTVDSAQFFYARFWGQMTDELPMVYSSCAFIYSLKLVGSNISSQLN